jgi:hypothetical protein
MDRCFNEAEVSTIISDSLETATNLLPYYCKENRECWWSIKKSIRAVTKHNITPEEYWHGNADEFIWFLAMLSSGFPSEQELLRLARRKTSGEIKMLADHYYQHMNVMFDHETTHHGYVVLRPTEYMLTLYPGAKDTLYAYTRDKWVHKELSGIDKAVLVFQADQISNFPDLLKKKLNTI